MFTWFNIESDNEIHAVIYIHFLQGKNLFENFWLAICFSKL